MASKTQKRSMDLGKVLLWSAVLVEAPRWAGAMLAADVSVVPDWLSLGLNVLNTISGVFMGVVIVVATAYLLDALRQTKPTITIRRKNETLERKNFRFYGLLTFVAGLLTLTPFVLGPYIVSRMTGQTMAAVLTIPFWQYAWAVTVVVAPAFVVGGVAFAQPGLVKLSETGANEPVKVSESSAKPQKIVETKPKFRDWRKVTSEHRRKIAEMNVDQVMVAYGIEERTAYNWIENARKEAGNGHRPTQDELPVFGEQLSVSVEKAEGG